LALFFSYYIEVNLNSRRQFGQRKSFPPLPSGASIAVRPQPGQRIDRGWPFDFGSTAAPG